MKTCKSFFLKWSGMLASLALVVGVSSSSTACWYLFYQPKVPTKLLTKRITKDI